MARALGVKAPAHGSSNQARLDEVAALSSQITDRVNSTGVWIATGYSVGSTLLTQ